MSSDPLQRNPVKIIRASAPVRINDLGGWTDTWFSGEGKVLNLAVSPRTEVRLDVFDNPDRKEERVRIHAENFGATFTVHPEKPKYDRHPILQGAINALPIPENVALEITLRSEVPAGSSTGTSASACVALLGALDHLTQEGCTKDKIVSLAHRVETEKLGLQSGIQDQICAAYGGACFIHMHDYPDAEVTKLDLDGRIRDELDRRLSLIYLGQSHSSSALHEEVIAHLESKGAKYKILDDLRDLVDAGRKCLLAGDLDAYGKAMIQNNECQRSLHAGLISDEADAVIRIAKARGAAGWKVNGAGGKGGSLTLLGGRDDEQRSKMLEEITGLGKGIVSIPIALSFDGLYVSGAGL